MTPPGVESRRRESSKSLPLASESRICDFGFGPVRGFCRVTGNPTGLNCTASFPGRHRPSHFAKAAHIVDVLDRRHTARHRTGSAKFGARAARTGCRTLIARHSSSRTRHRHDHGRESRERKLSPLHPPDAKHIRFRSTLAACFWDVSRRSSPITPRHHPKPSPNAITQRHHPTPLRDDTRRLASSTRSFSTPTVQRESKSKREAGRRVGGRFANCTGTLLWPQVGASHADTSRQGWPSSRVPP